MRTILRFPHPAGLIALALVLTLAACDNIAGPDQQAVEADASTDLTAMADYLSQELSLSASQSTQVGDVMTRNEDRQHEPGFLWQLAADLQASLTAEQKQRLFDLAARLQEAHGAGNRPGGQGPHHGPGGRDGLPGGGFLDSLLTDAQQAAVQEIRERYRTSIQEAFQARRDGTLDDEGLRARLQELHEAMRAEIEALLTDEQKAALEAHRAEHETEREARRAEHEAEQEARRAAERAAMFAALGLDEAGQAAVTALFDEYEAQREALREQVEAGEVEPEAARETLQALHEAERAALADLLDATQFEIVQIHDALHVVRPRFAGNGNGGHGPGSMGPGGNGGMGPGGMGPGGNGGQGQRGRG